MRYITGVVFLPGKKTGLKLVNSTRVLKIRDGVLTKSERFVHLPLLWKI
jgi:hypothetical protein